jgi:tRNA 2-selenouridine synthase
MMSDALPLVSDYRTVLRQPLPLLDLRAPVEFAKGAFTNARNLALMTDTERAAVGTCYKQQGQQAAVALGHQLVTGDVKQQRLLLWQAFIRAHPEGALYCARGGMRSQIVQQWLADSGVIYPRINGGFKALRRVAIEVIEQAACQPLLLVAGPTGSGKTRLLQQLQAVDLEGLANHRGSAFGRRLSAQPTQIRFENDLAGAILRANAIQRPYLLLEDESLLIGQRNIPQPLYQAMQQSPLLLLDEPLPDRVEVILQDYIIDLYAEAAAYHAEQGFELFSNMLRQGMARISKRLGGALYSELQALLEQALIEQAQYGQVSLHRLWIARLLTNYYDPMYQYQLKKRSVPILHSGNATELMGWWQHNAR